MRGAVRVWWVVGVLWAPWPAVFICFSWSIAPAARIFGCGRPRAGCLLAVRGAVRRVRRPSYVRCRAARRTSTSHARLRAPLIGRSPPSLHSYLPLVIRSTTAAPIWIASRFAPPRLD